MFKTIQEAQNWIESIQKFGSKYNTVRMEKAVEMLGHPERAYPTIHVGGTNGKGSTVSYLNHILSAAGYKVGAFISPYVIKINERFMINQTMISDEDFLKYANQIHTFYHDFDQETHDALTFFELMTLIGFLYNKDQKVDIAIIEVGLGGRLDATNVIDPLVSVITSIGYDHMHILGNTLEAIAGEKLGIVKPGRTLVSGVLEPELMPLFEHKAKQMNADYRVISSLEFTPSRPQSFTFLNETFHLSMVGPHQVQNAKCAILASLELEKHGFKIGMENLKKGLLATFWPGRFEFVDRFILEGAHNINGMEMALQTLKAYGLTQDLTVIFGVMADKETLPMQSMVEAVAKKIIFTQIDHPRAMDKALLYERSTHPNKAQGAVEDVIQMTSGPTLIIGSLYLISALRRQLIS